MAAAARPLPRLMVRIAGVLGVVLAAADTTDRPRDMWPALIGLGTLIVLAVALTTTVAVN